MPGTDLRIWITRTQPGADRLAADLRSHGMDTLVAPVLVIEPVQAQLPNFRFDSVVFLSEHAAALGADKIRVEGSDIFAVGERTKTVLAELGVDALIPESHSSEGLLELPELTEVSSKRILLIAGEAGRDLLARQLEARGAAVHRLSLYRRVPVQALVQPHSDALREVGAIVVSSGDGFENAARLWFAANGNADVPVLVPSARVARKGGEMGFNNVHDCKGADSAAVLRVLRNLQKRG